MRWLVTARGDSGPGGQRPRGSWCRTRLSWDGELSVLLGGDTRGRTVLPAQPSSHGRNREGSALPEFVLLRTAKPRSGAEGPQAPLTPLSVRERCGGWVCLSAERAELRDVAVCTAGTLVPAGTVQMSWTFTAGLWMRGGDWLLQPISGPDARWVCPAGACSHVPITQCSCSWTLIQQQEVIWGFLCKCAL